MIGGLEPLHIVSQIDLRPSGPALGLSSSMVKNPDCKTREIPISEKWQNGNFDYKIVISVKNP